MKHALSASEELFFLDPPKSVLNMSAIVKAVSKLVLPAAALLWSEKFLFHTGGSPSLLFPRFFGLVILVNFVGSGFLLTILGSKVGQARKQYNVPLPQMYAAGDSKDAVAFNCVQRGHQQALETYPLFLILSLVSGIGFPLLTAGAGAMWIYARHNWAAFYAKGDPEKRYGHWSAVFIWHTLIVLMFCCIATAVELLLQL